jgi:molybdopterin biosynthesis enzyme MoaB
VSPEREATLGLPRSILGWDVFCWIGHRRFARHWSVPQILAELQDSYQIGVSEDALEDAIARYQAIVAAREQDPERLAEAYRDVDEVVLSIDGLQPEKGHETLYVVRELTQKRIWFGEALVSSSAAEVRRLIVLSRQWAERLGKRVRLWMSDKQDAFLSGIAAEFPDVPHRYCQNHFLRDVAQPMLETDSHAKVRMRSKVRGLRTIERDLLSTHRTMEPATVEDVLETSRAEAAPESPASHPPASVVALDYCTVVKGILNDDQGGPLHPPGLRMAEALQSVRQSLERNLRAKKGGPQNAR